MAHDLLGGTTETNWARGTSSKNQTLGSTSELPIKYSGDLEEIRQKVWKGSYPIVFDSTCVSDDLSSHPGQSDESVVNRKAIYSRLLKSGKMKLSNKGRRLDRKNGEWVLIDDSSMGYDRRTRIRRLKHIVKKAAQGDQQAITRVQQIQQILNQRAAAGDSQATTILQKIQQWYSAYMAEYQTSLAPTPVYYPTPGTLYPSVLGSSDESGLDLNDDEGAIAREEGACERQAVARMRGIGSKPTDQPIDVFGRSRQRSWQRSGSRKRRLRQLVQKAAQGDTQASARLQLIQQRLSQRAASGDTRATSLLQRIQQWQTQYQGTQYPGTPYPGTTLPYQTPYPTPYQALYQAPYQQPYTPSAPADEEAELATTNPDL